jgi:hypothetical protein
MEAGADDNQRIMSSERSEKEAGHNAIISRPFLILLSPRLAIGSMLALCGGIG